MLNLHIHIFISPISHSMLFWSWLSLLLINCATSDTHEITIPASAHHDGNGFKNVYNNPHNGFGAFLKWRLGLGPHENPPIPADSLQSYHPVAIKPDFEKILQPDTGKIQITWIGHSSFLLQVTGKNILTDPVFSRHISPVSFLGPERQAPLPLELSQLPAIDAVIISHDHYDHLDKSTIKYLGNRPKYFVPLKVRKWFQDLKITNVVELDWWQSEMLDSLRFTEVPAQHFSGRSPFRFNRTLWAGWVIECSKGRIYFAGDTGYSPHFREIAERIGEIKIALLPIGAYRPRWFMKAMHLDPPEAVQAYFDLKTDYAIGMHWGTFKQSDEPLAEPPLYLKKAAEACGIQDEKIKTLRFGETVEF
jgi:N-acyl-phosphatidylethanolamine-hydrolysing phospholipase D